MFCKQCHYDLRSISALQCPECGTAFDPTRPDSFDAVFPSWWRRSHVVRSVVGWTKIPWWWLTGASAAMAYGVAVAPYDRVRTPHPGRGTPIACFIVLAAIFFLFGLWRQRAVNRTIRRDPSRN